MASPEAAECREITLLDRAVGSDLVRSVSPQRSRKHVVSSGNYDGWPAIRKRGASVMRGYMYRAALCLIRDDASTCAASAATA